MPNRHSSAVSGILSLGIPDDRWTSVIHPTACIATDAVIGTGSFVGPFVVVEPGVVAGSHVCLRGHSYISHDVRLGNFAFVGSQATVLGRVVVKDGAFVGAGAVCREHGSVGRFAVVGAGAVVLNPVPDFAIVAGNPARQIGTVATRRLGAAGRPQDFTDAIFRGLRPDRRLA